MAKKRRSRLTHKQKQTSAKKTIPVWAWFGGGAILAALFVSGLLYLGIQETSLARSTIQRLKIFANPGAGHQEGEITYTDEVPVGGAHNPVWQNCGIYDEPIQVSSTLHSLEHGAVWIAYQPDLPADQVDTLRKLVNSERIRTSRASIILAPKPELDAPIIATAWQAQLELEDASDEGLEAFTRRYQQGPFAPEPNATCRGGVDEPR